MTQNYDTGLSCLIMLPEGSQPAYREGVFQEQDLSAALYFLITDKEVYQGGDLDEIITLLLIGLEI